MQLGSPWTNLFQVVAIFLEAPFFKGVSLLRHRFSQMGAFLSLFPLLATIFSEHLETSHFWKQLMLAKSSIPETSYFANSSFSETTPFKNVKASLTEG